MALRTYFTTTTTRDFTPTLPILRDLTASSRTFDTYELLSTFWITPRIKHHPNITHRPYAHSNQAVAASFTMPYNNTPIAPNKEITGHVSLPRK